MTVPGFRAQGFGGCAFRVQREIVEREFFVDNLLVQIYSIIEMVWWTGFALWEFEFTFPGSLVSTFLAGVITQGLGCAVVASDEGVPDEQEERIATCLTRVLPPPVQKANLLNFPPPIYGYIKAIVSDFLATSPFHGTASHFKHHGACPIRCYRGTSLTRLCPPS